MGIFEKSIPRYTYDPVQKLTVQPVQDYYVDDIFDPIFNRNVRNALTQKYGNPILGTLGGYYEGIENALFGQDDKWGILGPGMGILSGFGRSMDKAGDVILGTLTEGVKGFTGQGFENPVENIFAEDQNYTGRRALAALGNSMSRFVGGTKLTEEDFGGGFGPVALGIELATDPSILGGRLEALSKSPSVLEQLGHADNRLGEVGRFLQQYDSVMAKAAIDLTAPGLRPAIRVLKGKLAHLIPGNSATNYVNWVKKIETATPDVPESMEEATKIQTALRNDATANNIADAYDRLDELEKTVASATEKEFTERELLKLMQEYVPEASEAGVVKADMARRWARRIRDAVRTDLKLRTDVHTAYRTAQKGTLESAQELVKKRDTELMEAYHESIRRAEGVVNAYKKAHPEMLEEHVPSTYELYENFVREHFGKDVFPDEISLKEWMGRPYTNAPTRAYAPSKNANGNVTYTPVYQKISPRRPDERSLMFGGAEAYNAKKRIYFKTVDVGRYLPDSLKKYFSVNGRFSKVKLNEAQEELSDILAKARKSGTRVRYEDLSMDAKMAFVWEARLDELWQKSPTYTSEFKKIAEELDAKYPYTYGDALSEPEFVEKIKEKFFQDIPDLNPRKIAKPIGNTAELLDAEEVWNEHYVSDIDFSPSAWEFETFSPNESLNKSILDTLGSYRKSKGTVENFATISPSEIGKYSSELLVAANDYAERLVQYVFRTNSETFPKFTDKASFDKIIHSDKFVESLKSVIVKESDQAYTVKKLQELLDRVLFPPKQVYGKPYDVRRRLKDFEELRNLLNDSKKIDLERLGAKLHNVDAVYAPSGTYRLDTIEHPWRAVTGRNDDDLTEFLETRMYVGDSAELQALRNDLQYVRKRYNYKGSFDRFIEKYTVGICRNKNLTYAAALRDLGVDQGDFDVIARAVDDFRQLMHKQRSSALALTTPDSVRIFEDLRNGLNDFYDEMVKPLKMVDSEAYSRPTYSMNTTRTNSSGDVYNPSDVIAAELDAEDYESFSSEAISAASKSKSSRGRYGDGDFEAVTESVENAELWVLRNLINSNPKAFENIDDLTTVMEPLRPFVQIKLSKPVGDVGAKDIERFTEHVLPELRRALSDGQRVFRSSKDKAFAKAYPHIYHALHVSEHKDAYRQILNFIKRDFGVKGKVQDTAIAFAYHKALAENPELISKYLPDGLKTPEFADRVADAFASTVTMGWKSYDQALLKAVRANPELANLYAIKDSGKALSGWLDGRYLTKGLPEYDTLLAYLQTKRLQQELKRFDLVQGHTRFGKAAFYSKDLPTLFGDTARTVSDVAKEFGEVPKLPKTKTFADVEASARAVVVEEAPETVAKMIDTPPTAASTIQAEVLGPAENVVKLLQDGVPEETVKRIVSEEEWEWFKQIEKASSVRLSAMGLTKNAAGEYVGRASLRTRSNAALIERGKLLHTVGAASQDSVRRVYGLLDASRGDVVKGVDFVNEICSTGILHSAYKTKAAADAVRNALESNARVFNSVVDGDVIKVIERRLPNGNFEVIAMLNTENTDLVAQVGANYKKLMKAQFGDVEFMKAHKLTAEQLEFLKSSEARMIISYLNAIDEASKRQSKLLGLEFSDALHAKHVRDTSGRVAEYVSEVINNGVPIDDIDEAVTLLSNLDGFRQRFKGTFGTQVRGRKYRGAYWNYDTPTASLFTYNLEKIAKGSLGDGIYANSNFQTWVELFNNDNFNVHQAFDNVDDLRKFMYAGGAEGINAGNLKNIDLCTPILNTDGKIVGIHRFDVYSDAGLQKALDDPDTILVPANIVDTLDKLLRKEKRLTNKFYAFVNKHFTIPFKFGVLTNPGFLIGNVSDAYLKQAVSMAEKYGTDVSKELETVAESATMYFNLGNAYNAAVGKWIKHMDDIEFELEATERVPEVLAGHPPSRKRLMEYLSGTLKDSKGNPVECMLTDEEAGSIMLWSKLQQIQHTSNSLREFDDIADLANGSKFSVHRNVFDRIFQGSGQYHWKKPSTYGLLLNNPLINGSMKGSEFIENTMRGTAILNDLVHAGYSKEDIFKILLKEELPDSASTAKRVFEVDYANAVNAMYESNFNYERMSGFMEGVGKAMPFPTFFLKNFSYWLELFEKDPQFFDHAITVHETMWGHRDTSKDEFLAEAKGRGAVPVGGQKLSKFFKGIYKPTPLQSMFGAFNLVNQPVENLSYRLHPLISGSAQAVNQALPHSPLTTFLGEAKYRPYSTDIYERNVKQDDENFNSLAYAMHRSNPFERTVNTALRTPKKVAEGQAQLSDFLPSVFQPDFSKK